MVLTYNYDTARPGKGELGDFLQVGFLAAPAALAGALYFTMHHWRMETNSLPKASV